MLCLLLGTKCLVNEAMREELGEYMRGLSPLCSPPSYAYDIYIPAELGCPGLVFFISAGAFSILLFDQWPAGMRQGQVEGEIIADPRVEEIQRAVCEDRRRLDQQKTTNRPHVGHDTAFCLLLPMFTLKGVYLYTTFAYGTNSSLGGKK